MRVEFHSRPSFVLPKPIRRNESQGMEMKCSGQVGVTIRLFGVRYEYTTRSMAASTTTINAMNGCSLL
jgi:hypothetical protein